MNPPKQVPAMIIAARMYHVISLVLHAGQRVRAQLALLPQFGQFIVISRIRFVEKLMGDLGAITLAHHPNQRMFHRRSHGVRRLQFVVIYRHYEPCAAD
jgi:hypothetical protein